MQPTRTTKRTAPLTALVLTVAAFAVAPAARAQTYTAPAPPGTYVPDDDGSQAEEVPVGVDGDAYADTDPSALTDFRSTLDPHGSWVDDPTYGQLWVPNADEVGPDFAPYVSEGSWAYDDDYVWMSNYEWGWVAFHYGRWAWTSGRWGWVPGRTYAGAWVAWRTGPDGYGYVGWGPLAPSFGWRGGAAYGLGAAIASRPGPTVFVGREELFARRVSSRVVVGERMATIAGETRPYVHPEPLAMGQAVAQPAMHGPPPAALGIQASSVVRVDPGNPNVARARAFARPSTARPYGAHEPVPHTVRVRRGAGAVHGGVVHAAPPPQTPQAPARSPGVVRGGGGRGRR